MELTEHRTVKDTVDHQLKHFSSRENLLRLSESRQLILLFLRPWCVPELWICRLSSGLMPCVRQLPWRKDLEFEPRSVGLGDDTGCWIQREEQGISNLNYGMGGEFRASWPSTRECSDVGSPAESFLLQSSARARNTYLGSSFLGQSPGAFFVHLKLRL